MDRVSGVALGDAGITAVAVMLACYEAWLFWHRPKHREHLWLTVMCLATAVHAGCLVFHYDAGPALAVQLLKGELAALIILTHCLPFFAMAKVGRSMVLPKWVFVVSAIFWLALVPTPWVIPDQLDYRVYLLLDKPFPRRIDTLLSLVGTAYALILIFSTAWWLWKHQAGREQEARHFALGALVWGLFGIHSGVLGALGWTMPTSTFEYGFVFFALALVASDAQRYMRMLTASTRDFRALVEGAPEAIAIIQAGVIRHANPAILEILGHEDAAHVHGRGLDSVVHAEDISEVQALLDKGVASPVVAARFLRADQGEVELELVALPIEFEGAPAAVLLARNVTERRRLTARTMEMDRIISMGTLAAGIGHEINNPLAYVLLNLEQADQELGDAEGGASRDLAEHIAASLDGVRRIRAIVDGLARFSRAEKKREPLAVDRVIRTAADIAGNQIKLRARLELELDEELWVLANETRLVQVFVNLLVNAAQAIPEGRVERNVVRVTASHSQGGDVRCEVNDTGVGIEPAAVERIFEPFFTTKERGEGTGLGLGICRDSVQRIGGSITVESTLGKGTTVRLTLPASERPPEPEPLPESVPPLRRLRVLVVDDEPQLLRSLERLLGLWSDVTVASHADQALEVISANEAFDLILSDLMMPDRSGMDLYAQVIEDDPVLTDRFVFMTGGTFTAEAQSFRANSSAEFLDKPVGGRELKALLERIQPRAGE